MFADYGRRPQDLALVRSRSGFQPPPRALLDGSDWSREPVRYPDTLIRSMFLRRPQTLAFFLRNPRETYLHFQGRCLAVYVSLGAADAQQAVPYSLSPLSVALGANEFAPEAERGCVGVGITFL